MHFLYSWSTESQTDTHAEASNGSPLTSFTDFSVLDEARANSSVVELNFAVSHWVSKLFTTLIGFGSRLLRQSERLYIFTTPTSDLQGRIKETAIIVSRSSIKMLRLIFGNWSYLLIANTINKWGHTHLSDSCDTVLDILELKHPTMRVLTFVSGKVGHWRWMIFASLIYGYVLSCLHDHLTLFLYIR